jgi:hypothetical protein
MIFHNLTFTLLCRVFSIWSALATQWTARDLISVQRPRSYTGLSSIILDHIQLACLFVCLFVCLTPLCKHLTQYRVESRDERWMMNWESCGRKQSSCNFKALSRNLPGTDENHENLSNDSRSPGRDLNLGPPEYEAGVLTTRSWFSVPQCCKGEQFIETLWQFIKTAIILVLQTAGYIIQ